MGQLRNGQWIEGPAGAPSPSGRYEREESAFRGHLSADDREAFPAERGRYCLYASLACPWAHRALIMRALKGLESMIDVVMVAPRMLENGWQFSPAHPDHLHGFSYLYQLYTRADPRYSGHVTVPVLWDKQRATIVNNESAEIIRMFNDAFDHLGARPGDYYPAALRSEIEAVNQRVYETVNNGVYKAGFAGTQEAHDGAVHALFETLDWLEARLEHTSYLVRDTLTEADIRLFTTLLRFDAVYYGHFKCNLQQIKEYPRLRAHRRRIYELPGVAATVDMPFIKEHYYASHRQLNPSGIVPQGPREWL